MTWSCEQKIEYLSKGIKRDNCLTFEQFKERENYYESVGNAYASMSDWQGNVDEDYIF